MEKVADRPYAIHEYYAHRSRGHEREGEGKLHDRSLVNCCVHGTSHGLCSD